MLRSPRVARALTIACAVVLHARPASAGDPAAAREQLKTGYALAQEGKCAEALPHLEESLRLDPKAITLINLASCEEKAGKLAEALGHWVDARARAQSEGAPAIEDEAVKRATALEKRMPRLTIGVRGDRVQGMEIARDGIVLGAPSIGMPLPLNPGRHLIVVRAPGRDTVTTELMLIEAEEKSIDVAAGLPSKAEASPSRASGRTSPLVYVGFGVATVGVAVGTITGLMAISRANACPDGQCPDQDALDGIDGGRTLGWISTSAFVLGAVGIGVGVYGLVAGGKRQDPSIAVSVAPSGAIVRGRF